jgi:Rieske Fe-S protein
MEAVMEEVSRREVVLGAMGAAAAGVVCCGVAGCGAMKKDEPKVIQTGVVNIGSAGKYPAGKVNQQWLGMYGIVVANDSGPVMAIRPRCTHLYCTVKWKAADFQFECPCHGSKFDLIGRVTEGPAKRPLAAVEAEAAGDGTLTVDLDRLYAI